MKIEYTKVGDYYLPNLYYQEETRPIGFWGMLRKEYLKEHKSGTYTYLESPLYINQFLFDDFRSPVADIVAVMHPFHRNTGTSPQRCRTGDVAGIGQNVR